MGAPRTLRFGVMCNGDRLEAAFAEAVRELLRLDGVELALVIVDASPPRPSSTREKLKKLAKMDGILWTLYQRLFPLRELPCYRAQDVSDVFAGVPHLHCSAVRKGKFSLYFTPEDVARIREHRLDFMLRFAFGIVRGDVLQAARYGVWSYHHGDEEKIRGAPPAFWEIHNGEPTTGALLQRLTDRLDGGVVLQKCWIRTDPTSYARNLDNIVAATSYMPARVARDLLDGCAEYVDAPPSRTEAPVYRAPNNRQMVRCAARMARAWVARQWEGVFYAESWNVGVARAPIETFLNPDAPPRVEWLPPPAPNRFVADPFVHVSGSRALLMLEEFDDRTGRGRIVARALGAGPAGDEPALGIDEGLHLSYPYLLEHEGRLYCVPECHQSRSVVLYELDPVAQRWARRATLLDGVAAVDPTVVRHDGRWWMFCTAYDDHVDGKLLLWHADDLLGPWRPHRANPVKFDVRSGRPAGTPFVHEGSLYRPAQNSSRTYGGSITVNRVVCLTEREFHEEPAVELLPWAGTPYDLGTHTLAGHAGLTVTDGKRRRFAPGLVGGRLVHKLGRLAGRAPKRRACRGGGGRA